MTVLGEVPNPYAIAANLLDPPDESAVEWAARRLPGTFLWSKQRAICESVASNRRTAVRSCHDSGKSFVAALIAAWWLDSHLPGEAFVVSSAPSWPQVRAILWREIGRVHRKGGLVGRVNQTEWHISNEIVGYGRKPADYDEHGFQGIHAKFVLVILDEACGIPKQLWDAADTLITNEYSAILAIGNPDTPATEFETLFRPASGWNTIQIKAWDTPNFTDEQVPDAVRHVLLSPTWVEEKRAKWTESSPLWISKVEAEFPLDAEDGIVPWSWIDKCRYGWPERHAPGDLIPIELGVDVGAGGDLTVCVERRGVHVARMWENNSSDPERVASAIMVAVRSCVPERPAKLRVKIDVIGWGWGIMGLLRQSIAQDPELRGRVEVVPVNVAAGSGLRDERGNKRFLNLRAEIWWEVGRELSRTRGWDLGGCDEDTLAELVAPRYSATPRGLLKVEAKDEVKDRLGRSPDHADALLLAFFNGGGRSKKVRAR